MNTKPDSAKTPGLADRLPLRKLKPRTLIVAGALLLLVLAVTLITVGNGPQDNQEALADAQKSLKQLTASVQGVRRALQDQQVQELAAIAVTDPAKMKSLRQYVSGRVAQLIDLQLYGPELESLRGGDMGPYGYALLDMLMTARSNGLAPAQIHGQGKDAYLALAVRVGDAKSPQGYLLARVKPDTLFADFKQSLPQPGIFALSQYNGRFPSTKLLDFANPPKAGKRVAWLKVPGALFRIGVLQNMGNHEFGGLLHALLLVFGLLLLGLGILLKLRPPVGPGELQEDPLQMGPADSEASSAEGPGSDHGGPDDAPPGPPPPPGKPETDRLGKVDLPDLSFQLEKRDAPFKKVSSPVKLSAGIFRAYDIRGVVGKTLDANVARQVGQAVGSLAVEQQAAPVVVARDGRLSGGDLVEGMIDGLTAAGCDVIDIGAVPTGVLYFAAYELGPGSGVMVTGSHNPPDYNGFKLMVAGKTLSGDEIKAVYERIQSGDLRVGKGSVRRESMLERYRERIAADIQLKRPLRVVADCGNGIGGACAPDVLRDIGATVIPLFDEVDGTFPNHHPDPSEPKNLKELIESVDLMEADLGVAFDGDADRLGVVTQGGHIIYPDRLMMLFARDILSREPGSTIIYDVKCTGHLREAIEAAGGKPMMYKTGHSLIKNKMKEVGAPFAGEMSGHFFFKERWYGFDCGIYAAARLLEILAASDKSPGEVLNGLPDSVSTPELKVAMEEGENHAFIAELQEKAQFADAKVNTIDGVRADFADGWGLVRASNTTPVLVLRFDADSREALARIQGIFKQQMLAVKEDLDLPF
ncbi:MAG: phosphomannomutase/phosphoglucomutase [Lysobacterales bacterium]|jgi:phosphomannomutase/phosphoglucomutase